MSTNNVFIAEGYDGGTFTCGAQRTGKTTLAIKELERKDKPVFFWNPQKSPTKFCKVDGRYSINDILKALRDGEKLDFQAPANNAKANKMLYAIAEGVFEEPIGKPLVWAIDEVSFYLRDGQQDNPLLTIVRRGEGYANIEGYYIAQFPATVHKDLLRGTYTHNIFYCDKSEKEYFRTKGIDYDKVIEILHQGGQYSYAKITGGELNNNYHKEK